MTSANGANTNDWLEATKNWTILAYIPTVTDKVSEVSKTVTEEKPPCKKEE